jgi:hypothetical protein
LLLVPLQLLLTRESPSCGEKTAIAQCSGNTQIVTAILIALLISYTFMRASNTATFDIPDGDVAALITAIHTANDNGRDDSINLQGGVYTLINADNDELDIGSNGLPCIGSGITLNGHDSTIAAIGLFRIFCVGATGRLGLNRVIVQGHPAL